MVCSSCYRASATERRRGIQLTQGVGLQKQVGVARAGGRRRSIPEKSSCRQAYDNRAAHLLWSVWRNLGAAAQSAAVLSVAEPLRRVSSPLVLGDPPSRWSSEIGWRLLSRFLADFAQTHSLLAHVSRSNPSATIDGPSATRLHPHIEYRPLSSTAGARCALLKSGGLRVYAPEPTGVHTFLLLTHEYAHALLALQAPGSLSDFVQTESHALALERCAGRWLARQSTPCLGADSGDIQGDLKQWWRGRRHVWTVYHQRLAVFEAEMARVCLLSQSCPKASELDEWWRAAHVDLAATMHSSAQLLEPAPASWMEVPALFATPGNFLHSQYIWRHSAELARRPVHLRDVLFGVVADGVGVCGGASLLFGAAG